MIGKVQGHANVIKAFGVYDRGVIRTIGDEITIEDKEVFAVMILETLRGGELMYHIKKCGKFSIPTSRYFFK